MLPELPAKRASRSREIRDVPFPETAARRAFTKIVQTIDNIHLNKKFLSGKHATLRSVKMKF